jgi:uncharacterized SAM-binding protein YcdF (DUF218 family)
MEVDAIVVLGCALRQGGQPSGALRRRLDAATRCWAEATTSTVVLSGGRVWWGHAEASVMRRELLKAGLPQVSLVSELCSLNTWENARYCRRIGVARGFRRIALVTCDFHMARAVQNFAAFGFDCVQRAAVTPDAGIPRFGPLGRRLASLCRPSAT